LWASSRRSSRWKETLTRDLAHVLAQRPELRLAKITDARRDDWEYLATLAHGPEILDLVHASDHLAAAIAAVTGEETMAPRHELEALRERLLTDGDGVDAVTNALTDLRRTHPHIQHVARSLARRSKGRVLGRRVHDRAARV